MKQNRHDQTLFGKKSQDLTRGYTGWLTTNQHKIKQPSSLENALIATSKTIDFSIFTC